MNYNGRVNALERIANNYNLTETKKVQNYLKSYEKDFNIISGQIQNLADKRKAAIDRKAT